jgi:purine-binding chemotaxis protein CheW
MSQVIEAMHGEFISFRVAGQLLGIPVQMVQEVLTAQRITRVPLAAPEVAGFLNLRGQIVTAVDLRARLDLPPRAEGESVMNVVVKDKEELFSLLVDEVGDVIEVSADIFETPPPTMDERWRQSCEGVYRLKGELLVAVNVPALLNLQRAKD